MSSKKQLTQPSSNLEVPDINLDNETFITSNQEAFNELLTFIDFVDEKLNIGFVEVNFSKDRETLIAALEEHPRCQDVQFIVFNFPNPNLRFLRDDLVEELNKIAIEPNKKLVIIITGLEKSIGMTGDYPPVLQDLNFIRDAFTTTIPYPILFFLPDYAITRLAKYAPDFWAWRRGLFCFKTIESTKDYALEKTLQSDRSIWYVELPEKQERIDLLERLLMEYNPSNHQETLIDIRTHIQILLELGRAYLSQGEYLKAKQYLEEALKLVNTNDDLAQITSSVLYELGKVEDNLGQIEEAIALYQKSLEVFEKIGDIQGKAATLHCLAMIDANQGQIEEAIALYQQVLELNEHIGDMQGKAATLHNLASIYAKQGQIEEAITFYQQVLEIDERIGDVQGKAATLHQIAIIYAHQGQIDEAITLFQQSLELKKRIGNVQGKAMTLWWLGGLAQQQGDFTEARKYLQESLEILQQLKSSKAEQVQEMLADVQKLAS